MRRLPFLLFPLLLLVFATTALAGSVASGDGSLVVAGANARILVVHGSGLIFGHIRQGTLTVVAYRGDPNGTQVNGSILRLPSGSATQYSGSDIRFLFPNGQYSLLFDGVGIDISAVGRGTVSATGVGSANDGSVGTNGGTGLPLGVTPTTLVFGASKGPNSVPSVISRSAPHQ